MQKQEVPEKPVPEEPQPSLWEPPPPPAFGEREWFAMIYERFGFLIACALTITVLVVLFLNADLLLNEPGEVSRPAPVAESMAPGAPAAATVALNVATRPAGAAIFINDDSVGVSPLQGYTLAGGTYRLSARIPNFAPRDTVVTLAGAAATVQLTLRQAEVAEADAPAEESPADDPGGDEAPVAEAPPAETDPDEPPAAANAAAEDTPQEPAPEEAAVREVGTLEIISEPPGATVWLGDQRVGTTPLVVRDVAAGTQQVTMRLDGYQPFGAVVVVRADQNNVVTGELPQILGTLKILAKPWGNIYVDGELRKQESTIWYTVRLTPGNHRVRVEHPSLGKWEQVIEVTAGQERSVEIDFNEGNSSSQ